MQFAVSDVDRIAQAVAQQLRAMGVNLTESAIANPTDSDSVVAAETIDVKNRLELPGPSSEESAWFRISDRVVSSDSLRAVQLKGIKQLYVTADAVVTPAAKDELRGLGIALHRGTGPQQACVLTLESDASALVVKPRSKPNAGGIYLVGMTPELDMLRGLVRGVTIERLGLEGEAATTAVQDLVESTAAARVIWQTSTPFAALQSLHGLPNVRAALLAHAGEFAAANDEIKPNVCILRNGGWAIGGLTRLTRLFAGAAV